jgi:hypothetical protein
MSRCAVHHAGSRLQYEVIWAEFALVLARAIFPRYTCQTVSSSVPEAGEAGWVTALAA